MIDMCKEDPVVFIETVCGIKMMEYQKVLARETFKTLKRPDKYEKIFGELEEA